MSTRTSADIGSITFSSEGICVGKFIAIDSNFKMPTRYIINKDATILFWEDDTKTIVKKSKNDKYDKRLGFLTAYFQKHCGMSKNKANKYLDSLVEDE